jgi:hypothetical protein
VNHERARKTAAAVVLVLLAVDIALSAVTHDPWPTNDGLTMATLLAYAAVGYVIVRTQPRNPIGWIFLALAMSTFFDLALRLYVVLDYREHGGHLPLGAAAVFWRGTWSLFPFLLGIPAIVLFPDARLSARWRRVLWAYTVGSHRRPRPIGGRHPRQPSQRRWRDSGGIRLAARPGFPRRVGVIRRSAGRGVALVVGSPPGAAQVVGGREHQPPRIGAANRCGR